MEDRGDIFASLSMHVAVYFGNCVRERPLFSTDFLFGLGWVGGLQPDRCSDLKSVLFVQIAGMGGWISRTLFGC